MLQAFDPEGLFVKLLAVSGFSGAIAWISICWSQLNFRRRLEAEGHDVQSLTFKVPFFPYVTHFGIWAQVACLMLMVLSDKLRDPLFIGIPFVIVPMVWYELRRRGLAVRRQSDGRA